MGLVDRIPVLTPEEAQRAVEDVHASRAHWTVRNAGTEVEFHTLGAASYLDAAGRQFDRYQASARRSNPVLTERFGWLHERLRAALASAMATPVRFDDRLARPGFHIYLYDAARPAQQASVHFDLQYELIDWARFGTPDDDAPLSLTLALALPRSGGGLLVWNLNRGELVRMDEATRTAHMRVNRQATLHAYTVGAVALHSGHQLHQIAPTPDPQPGDERITMQAHARRVDGEWILYW
jgi:hypothetical protein